MNRSEFLKTLSLFPLLKTPMQLHTLENMAAGLKESPIMPALFIGHGSPMNAIEDNIFSRTMKEIGKKLPTPQAILMVSAHWETKGTQVTIQEKPRTIHDFGGFPKALFDVEYPAPGSTWLAQASIDAAKPTSVTGSNQWGLDHGAWSVLVHLYPEANIPVVQLSLDIAMKPHEHYALGKALAVLRKKGVLIIGSGNMVHNFSYAVVKGNDFNAPFGHDWALEANQLFKTLIQKSMHRELTEYQKLGKAVALAVPTPEHYLPLLYTLASEHTSDEIQFFNDQAIAGSFTMTSVLLCPK